MANLVISERDAERLNDIVRREHRPIGEIVLRMIDSYVQSISDTVDPMEMTIEAAEREILHKLYAEARAYWYTVGDAEKSALTDVQLDEQFWCIDPDGIPRFKSVEDIAETS